MAAIALVRRRDANKWGDLGYSGDRILPEFMQHLLDWNARCLGSVGWLAILCLGLTFVAVFAIRQIPEMRTIRSDSFFGEDPDDEQESDNGS